MPRCPTPHETAFAEITLVLLRSYGACVIFPKRDFQIVAVWEGNNSAPQATVLGHGRAVDPDPRLRSLSGLKILFRRYPLRSKEYGKPSKSLKCNPEVGEGQTNERPGSGVNRICRTFFRLMLIGRITIAYAISGSFLSASGWTRHDRSASRPSSDRRG